jgi:hypothetical protein
MATTLIQSLRDVTTVSLIMAPTVHPVMQKAAPVVLQDTIFKQALKHVNGALSLMEIAWIVAAALARHAEMDTSYPLIFVGNSGFNE